MKRWKWILLSVVGLPLLLLAVMYALGSRTQIYRAEIELNASPDEVFAYLTQPDLIAQWVHGVQEIRPLTPGGHKVGARAIVQMEEQGTHYEFLDEVTESVPNKSLAVRSESEIFTARNRWLLTPAEEGTHLEVTMRVNFHGLFQLLAPLMKPQAKAQLQADFEKLRSLIESETKVPANETPSSPDSIENPSEPAPAVPQPRELSDTDDWMMT